MGGMIYAFLSQLLADEFKAWSPTVADYLKRRAVLFLPQELRERYQEEWASDLNETPGEIGKLIKAVGFIFAAHGIAIPERKVVIPIVRRSELTFGLLPEPATRWSRFVVSYGLLSIILSVLLGFGIWYG
jgi:hypothetical protein